MSAHPARPSAPLAVVPSQSNGLGIAGFVCSIVGLVSCGLFAPIGLALSIAAMFRQPRGLAIAGLIIGIAGCLWLLVAIIIFGSIMAFLAAMLAALGVQAGTYGRMAQVAAALQQYQQLNGSLPSALSSLSAVPQESLTDPWGHAFRYVKSADGKGYTLTSDGPDGLPGTADDVNWTPVTTEYRSFPP